VDARRAAAGTLKAARTAVAASLFLLLFYWRGLDCWFYQDDFGWMHLWPARDFRGLLQILFAPHAHGNLRPWSENLFFFGLHGLFGVHALPFRIVVFATVIADLFLLDRLVRDLTGSAWAALAAEICWLANPAVAPSLCWTCIYNQTQSLFFLLLALLLFVRGRYWAQAAVFVLGLGSLETMVMYPVIASLYALIYDRSKFRRTLPLYAISLVYTALHFWVAPAPQSGPYMIEIGWRMFRTFATYMQMVLGPENLAHFHWTWPAWYAAAGTVLMSVAVILAAVSARRAALFGIGWFLVMLAPVLPLPDHVLDYLLTVPAVGLAIVLGAAVAERRRVAAGAVAFYLAVALPGAWETMSWHHARSLVSRNLVEGVVEYDRAHPGKTLLLTAMSSEQFDAGFKDLPFELYGMKNVFLAPGAERKIENPIAPLYVLPEEKAQPLVDSGEAVVLDVSDATAGPRPVRVPSPHIAEPDSAAPAPLVH
jgi:hypothetical protein